MFYKYYEDLVSLLSIKAMPVFYLTQAFSMCISYSFRISATYEMRTTEYNRILYFNAHD